MAVIVEHKETQKRFVLLGAGFGAYKAASPTVLGNIVRYEESGERTLLAVCNANGAIGWIPSDDLDVVEVDGKSLGELLQASK